MAGSVLLFGIVPSTCCSRLFIGKRSAYYAIDAKAICKTRMLFQRRSELLKTGLNELAPTEKGGRSAGARELGVSDLSLYQNDPGSHGMLDATFDSVSRWFLVP